MMDIDQRVSGEQRTRVKMCGITRQRDAEAAIDAGADALGFVFYPSSPRALSIERAASICDTLPPFVSAVGLFVNATADEVNKVIDSVGLTLLQFHGEESPAFCEQFSLPYIKAFRMAVSGDQSTQGEANNTADLLAQMAAHPQASGFLLDAFQQGVPGGTGHTFDWTHVPSQSSQPMILAGGLGTHNVAAAIDQVRPFAVDVSSGIESAPGIKDAEKIIHFMREVTHS